MDSCSPWMRDAAGSPWLAAPSYTETSHPFHKINALSGLAHAHPSLVDQVIPRRGPDGTRGARRKCYQEAPTPTLAATVLWSLSWADPAPLLGTAFGRSGIGPEALAWRGPLCWGRWSRWSSLGGCESLPGSMWSRAAGSWDLAGFSATNSHGRSGGAVGGPPPACPPRGPTAPGDELSMVQKSACAMGSIQQ